MIARRLLRAGGPLAAAFALAAGACLAQEPSGAADAAPGGIEIVSFEDYVRRIRDLDEVAAARPDEARRLARALLGVRVREGDEETAPDAAVLAPFAAADGPVDAASLRRLRALRDSLSSPEGAPVPADPALLERVARDQALDALPEGALGQVDVSKVPLVERIAMAVKRAVSWLWARLGDFLRWLIGLLPQRQGATGRDFSVLLWVVGGILLVVVGGLAVVAWRALRRKHAPAPPPAEAPAPRSGRDEDPLSRTASEWERHAAALAAAGRLREAVRAWYHAVLVTCYAAGLLHHRKGRTNWEHVSLLSPAVTWRPRFAGLTREFDRRWYGMEDVPADAYERFAAESRGLVAAARSGRPA